MRIIFIALLACSTAIAHAATLEGKVVKVLDGDTLIVADATNGEHEVRLQGIDAPEDDAPYAQQSRDALTGMVNDEPIILKWEKTDRRGRLLADLHVGPVWVNMDMITQGWAKHAVKYSKDVQLANAELWARQHQLGIWKDVPPPVEPPAVVSTNVPLTIFTPAR
ncbi:MAG: thermonuclease family protein [Lentisphaerae bacterium]|nr:thermonuclease family protein [Lentisphaerota bacterium]